MSTSSSVLDDIRVASPCPARWEEMQGSSSTRFCAQCRHNVHDISAMTRAEAVSLLAGATKGLCVRYYRRTDGTIMTQDCPVGVRAIRQRAMVWVRTVAAAVLAFFAGSTTESKGVRPGRTPITTVLGRMELTPISDTDASADRVDNALLPDSSEPPVQEPFASEGVMTMGVLIVDTAAPVRSVASDPPIDTAAAAHVKTTIPSLDPDPPTPSDSADVVRERLSPQIE